MRDNWIEAVLEDVLDYIQPTNYIVDSTEYSNAHKIPVLTAGKSFILGFTNEEHNIFSELPVIIFDDFTTAIQFVNFRFKVKSSAMKILVPKASLVNLKYVYYFMQTIRHNSDTHKRYWISIYSKLCIKLAPLPEQRAIVAKIEELFSELDNGVANLNKAKEKLEIYRQAVLKKAFEGELTKEWRSRNLVDRNAWTRKKLGEVLKTIDGDRGKNYPNKNELLTEGYCLFLSTKNVRQGNFVFDDNIFITKEKDEILRGGKLLRNDVVITTRGTLGNVALYDAKVKFENVRINSGMLILRINDLNVLTPQFLMRYINSSLFFQQLKAKQSGTAQPQIPANVLREIEIEIPNNVDEQKQIIDEVENRLTLCNRIIYEIDESLIKADLMRQSILKQAFEGKLLSEAEIRMCEKESDWEPAEKLLEKIKNELRSVK